MKIYSIFEVISKIEIEFIVLSLISHIAVDISDDLLLS